ncbi:tropomyosin-like [Ambystoma mexicanum]|uniref:tropomyosin-like n=1 Tax=Ambystoma mexicanum TaxID=8296 RepID=UPI0037E95996
MAETSRIRLDEEYFDIGSFGDRIDKAYQDLKGDQAIDFQLRIKEENPFSRRRRAPELKLPRATQVQAAMFRNEDDAAEMLSAGSEERWMEAGSSLYGKYDINAVLVLSGARDAEERRRPTGDRSEHDPEGTSAQEIAKTTDDDETPVSHEDRDRPISQAMLSQFMGEVVEKITAAGQLQMDKLREDLAEGLREIKRDINKVEERVDINERAIQELTEDARKVDNLLKTLATATQNLELLAEDLENRSRRANIRVKSLPEDISDQELSPTLKEIFVNLLDFRHRHAI